MSVFNGENTIDDSISSLINQSYTNIEILIMNDGSTDGTAEKLEKYEKIILQLNYLKILKI